MARLIQPLVVFSLVLSVSCVIPPRPRPPRKARQSQIEDLVVDDVERCPVHDETLLVSLDSVDWERGSYCPSYYKIRSALFPCAFDDPLSDGDLAMVAYCPICRAAKAKFLKAEECPEPPMHLFGEDGFHERWQQDIDAFIARQRKELEDEYQQDR